MTPVAAVIIALIALLIGFLAGWLVEWRIDLSYWHTYFEEAAGPEPEPPPMMILPAAAPPPQLAAPEDSLLVQTLREQLTQREADGAALRGELIERERNWREREAQMREAGERQTLTLIEKLNASEVHWRETTAARETELSDELKLRRAQLDELRSARAEAELEAQHELAWREQQWQESKDAEVAALAEELGRLRAQLNDTQARFIHYQATHPDDLAVIDGIGEKIQDDLRQAGITSFAELARRTPDELQALLNPPKWRKLDFAAWIEQARHLMNSQP
jgi:predicted flap endonuclease-1-like 5' DNA nuclease